MTFSTSPGLSSNLAYTANVFISYISTDSIGSLIKRFAAKKAVKMVKSIINMKRSSICWRGRRELITDVRKPEIMVMASVCRQKAFCYHQSWQTCHARQNSNQQAPDATASFPLVGCLPQAAWPERLLSEKSGRCGIAAD